MAFDGFKKMADGVPDYLEVPVTEDGLLEKATAAIHALGYDMEEAISIFLRRIVQTVPSAADLAQAEEFIRKTADTSLDDMVTQPLLMPKRDVFSVELLDYATPGFCTNWKPCFGTLEDIATFRNALHRDEKRKTVDMSLAPVKVYGAKQKVRAAGMYEHTNIWGYPYFVWWDRLESVHLWIGSGGRFFRCVRARMKNLKYGTDENAAMIQSPGEQIWGYPHLLEYRHPFHFNRMYVIETRFNSEKEMMDDLESCDGSIELGGWLDELFGNTERIQRTLFNYLDASLPAELKDDTQLTDDLEEAISPMCRELEHHIGYSPEVRLCTVTRERIVWHREETAEAGFKDTDELVVIDEYGKTMSMKEFLASVGVKNIT